MPSAHAKLSPSSAERWLTCTASIRMAEAVRKDDQGSSYAMEGTLAHAMAEAKAGYRFKLDGYFPTTKYFDEFHEDYAEVYGDDVSHRDEMILHADAYVELLEERMKRYPNSVLMLEQKLDTGVERCWGTGDAVIVSPRHVEVIDLKYGQGVPVGAQENPQLMLYGVGALDTYGDFLGDVEEVFITVFQPRIDNTSTWSLPADELRAWRDNTVKPAGAEALSDNGTFAPSEKACRWCPAAGICRPRMEAVTAHDFDSDPDVLSPEDLAELLPQLSTIKAWAADVERAALDRMYTQGEDIPGFKVVQSRGRRVINDQALAIQTLTDAGYPADKTATFSLKPFGYLEKLVGKKDFTEILGDQISKTEGKPSIVPESDKRPPIDRGGEAARDFSD